MSEDVDAVAAACAQAMWERDAATRSLGIAIVAVSAGRAVLAMTVTPAMANSHGTCHGGVIFTLADSAFAYACNSRDVASVAYHCDVTFLAPAPVGDRLTAEAVEVERAGRSGVTDVTVRNAAGQAVAVFRGLSRTVGGPVRGPDGG